MGRTHGRAPIGQWCFCARGTCGGCGQRLLDVFETSLQEAITKRRRANDSDLLSSDDEELGDNRIWELIGSRPRKKPSLRPTTLLTLGRIYSITRLWQPGLQLRLPRELGLLLLRLLQKAPSLLWLPASLLQRLCLNCWYPRTGPVPGYRHMQYRDYCGTYRATNPYRVIQRNTIPRSIL